MKRLLLVIPGLILLAAGIYCLLGKINYSSDTEVAKIGGLSATINHEKAVPAWIGVLGCLAGLGLIVYGAGRRKY
jgi:hypothetical protein